MEHITQKINFFTRFVELAKVEGQDSSLTDLQEYIAQHMEMAYVAGANRLDINNIPRQLDDTGETIVLARGYVKDKGYRR